MQKSEHPLVCTISCPVFKKSHTTHLRHEITHKSEHSLFHTSPCLRCIMSFLNTRHEIVRKSECSLFRTISSLRCVTSFLNTRLEIVRKGERSLFRTISSLRCVPSFLGILDMKLCGKVNIHFSALFHV